jgi:hypothetical protein
MPKTPIDYSKGLIYSIVCKTDETLIYIGSTTNFRQRKNIHKSDCHNEKSHQHNYKVYVMIRANGGWDNFEMQPVKEYACENAIQLVIEEERIRKEMQATLNTRRAFISEGKAKELRQKYREEHITKIKEYRKEHAEELKEYLRKYREAHATKNKEYQKEHKAEIKERKRKYNQEHAAEIKERQQKYREEHKAEIKESQRKYAQEHKEEISKKRRENRLAKKLSQVNI